MQGSINKRQKRLLLPRIVDATATFQSTETDGVGNTSLDVGDLEQVRYKEEKKRGRLVSTGLNAGG